MIKIDIYINDSLNRNLAKNIKLPKAGLVN